ncbi:MAG: inositol monophosphatase family protein, partial [Pseudomonadota bacterium]
VLSELQPLMGRIAGVRRCGSAALDLAWTAAGRFDGFWEHELNAWDMAAGIVLVREAGGFATDVDGGEAPHEAGSIVAGNDFMSRLMLKNIAEARKAR